MQTFELETFLNNVLAPYRLIAEEKGAKLDLILDSASYIMLKSDPSKIKMLIGSVVESAIINSTAKNISFSARQLLRTEKEILLEFVLEDDGCLSKSPKKISYYRTLIKTQSTIEELDGKSELIISPDCGTTLKFIIKCELKEPSKDLHDKHPVSFLKNKTVLIVEDNEINQQMLCDILLKEEINYEVACNGKEAIELLEKSNHYDLILMDLHMPYMDGFQTANYIRRKLSSTVPVIAMSAEDGSLVYQMCLETGIDQFIKKPFAPKDLFKQMAILLGPIYHPSKKIGNTKLKIA